MKIKGYLKEDIEGVDILGIYPNFRDMSYTQAYILYRLHNNDIFINPEVYDFVSEHFRRELRQEAMKTQIPLEEDLLNYLGNDLFLTRLCSKVFNEIYLNFEFSDFAIDMKYNNQLESIFEFILEEDTPTNPVVVELYQMSKKDMLHIHDPHQVKYIINTIQFYRKFYKNNTLTIDEIYDYLEKDKMVTDTTETISQNDLDICLTYIKSKMPSSYFKQEGKSEEEIVLDFIKSQV